MEKGKITSTMGKRRIGEEKINRRRPTQGKRKGHGLRLVTPTEKETLPPLRERKEKEGIRGHLQRRKKGKKTWEAPQTLRKLPNRGPLHHQGKAPIPPPLSTERKEKKKEERADIGQGEDLTKKGKKKTKMKRT